MKTEDILKLIDAGFTRDEILNMDKPASGPDGSGNPTPGTPEPDPEPPAGGDPDVKALLQQNNELLQTIKQMQADNRHQANDPGTPEVGADDVIKDFFGPKKKRR